jgi:LAS superfamily LD-carboxypeptidase LdcB
MSNFSNGDFKTPYGTVTARNPGRVAAPPNLQTYQRPEGDVVLQGPALRSFKAAEIAATPRRMRRKGKVLPILLTGVGYRSYAYQKALYDSPANIGGRYADPDGSLHVEALAVDIDMRQSVFRRARIAYHLKKRGWHYAVSGEPWHASFKLAG